MKKSKCLCCGYRTLEAHGEYDICPVCFWEEDGTDDPDLRSEANHGLTLRQGRENYKSFGACERKMLPHVRKPYQEELD